MGNPNGEWNFGHDSGQSSLDNGQQGVQYGGQAQGTGINPNFQPLLSELPQDLHGKVLPHLQQWDKGVNERFEKLQSDYAPWKPILSSATPDVVQNSLALMNLLETNPKGLYEALRESYRFDQEQQQIQAGQGQAPPQQAPTHHLDPSVDMRFKQMEQNFTTVAEHVLQMRKQEEEARQDAMLAKEFEDAHKKMGDFDETWVRAQCLVNPNMSIAEGAKLYQQWYAAEMAKHGARPILTGSSGGGVPGPNVDVTKLNGQQTRAAALDIFRQMRRQSQ